MTSLDIKPRSFWTSAPIHPNVPRAIIPAKYRHGLVIHHNGPAVPAMATLGDVDAECRFLRAVEAYHSSKAKRAKIAWYSFAIGNSGNIYDLCGFMAQYANGKDQVGDDDGPDIRWFTCIWIGGGRQRPSPAATASFRRLVQYLRDEGAGNRVLPHNRFRIKACPGPELEALATELDGKPVYPPSVPTPLAPAVEDHDMDHFIFANRSRYTRNERTGRYPGWLATYGAPALMPVEGVPDIELVGNIVAVDDGIVTTQEGPHIFHYNLNEV